MRIIIVSNFSGALEGARAKGRFMYLGEMLCERGHDVELIASDFSHARKKHHTPVSINLNAYKTKITLLHEPGYPDNISVKRLWSHYVWGRNVERYLKGIEKPDMIYCAVPSLTAGVHAAKYCSKNNIKFMIDVQDLWPEAFQMAIKNKLLQKVFLPIEWYVNKIYGTADAVIAVSETYANRALTVNKKDAKGLSVFLGNDGALFDEARNSQVIEKSSGILQLCYIGTLGYSYDLKCAIDAVALYNKEKGLPHLQFVVLGSGPLQGEFEKYAKQKQVDALFWGRVPYQEMVARMCVCDIVINPIVKGAPQSITNKVGDYALSGLPVVSTQENEEYRRLVDKYQCGINCECGNAEEVANAIAMLAKDVDLRKTMGENARRLGLERFDRRYTYKAIVELIEKG